jgi:hypothetical protein
VAYLCPNPSIEIVSQGLQADVGDQTLKLIVLKSRQCFFPFLIRGLLILSEELRTNVGEKTLKEIIVKLTQFFVFFTSVD